MKILKTSFNKNLENKKVKYSDKQFNSAFKRYTGNIRLIKSILGKKKEQKEFYISEERFSLWKDSSLIKEFGPYWE